MLSEKLLIRSGLGIALVGLFFLFLLYRSVELPAEHLEIIDHDHLDETVKVRGEVVSVRHVKNVTLLTLSAPVEKKGVIFSPVNVSEGMRVELIGEVDEYNGESEIVISSLETID